MMIDSKSYVWVGTKSGGLVRYDGKDFESFGNSYGQVPRETIHCMYEDSNQIMYFGTERGLYSKTDSFRFHTTTTDRIHAISSWKEEMLLLGGTKGIFTFDKITGKVIQINDDDIGQVLSIQAGSECWLGTTKGLYLFDTVTQQITFVAKMIGQGVYAIEPFSLTKIWLASWNAGIIVYNSTLGTIDTVYRHPDFRLAQCFFSSDSTLWIGTQDKGLIALNINSGKHVVYGESEGLPHVNIKSITRDRQGQMWIGTHGGGIAVGTKQNFRQYDRSEGLASNRVYGIAPDQSGTWITAGDKFQLITSTSITTYDPDSLTRGVKCKSILRDLSNRIWVGTEGRGVIVMQGNRMSLINHLHGLTDPYIQQLAIDSQGQIFIATFTGGLFKIRESGNATIEVFPIPLPFKRITSLYIDPLQRIWVGSFEGELACLRNEKLIARSATGSGLPNQPIKSIITGPHDQVWIGTENRGIWIANDNDDTLRFTFLDLPLNSTHIYLLLNDADGNTWAGTEKGVNRISRNQEGGLSGVTTFGRNEGFAGIETTHNAAVVDQHGHLWFGTMNGLMRYTSGESMQNRLPPVLHMEDIRLFFKSLDQTDYAAAWNDTTGELTKNVVFMHRDNHISFEFKAIDLLRPDEIFYRWQLKGIEHTWSPPTTQSSVNYATLQPGQYILLVQAATDTSEWSEPILASFIIKPPVWQTTSFKIVLVIAIMLLIVGLVTLWTRFVRRREHMKRKQLEIDNIILQLEQKALQLQMNPHFLFNALTSIKSLVGKGETEAAQTEINAFAQLMRGVLNNSRKQLITLKEEIDVLNQYLHIEQSCHQHTFTYQIDIDPGIPVDEIELPPMLIQPFVENSIVHGIRHRESKGKVEIQFSTADNILRCEIRDNGIGREKAALLREEKKPGHQPIAIQVTTDRLTMMMKNQPSHNPIDISDITDADGKINGTRVVLHIPIKNDWT